MNEYNDFFVSVEASWYAGCYPFASNFRFQFERAVAAYESGKLTIYEQSGKTYNPIGASDADMGNIGLPASNAYADEIRYFSDCVKNNTPVEKVQPQELVKVIDLLKSL